MHLLGARLFSTARATCQSSNRLGYSAGSAKDSAAFGLTCVKKGIELEQEKTRSNLVDQKVESWIPKES